MKATLAAMLFVVLTAAACGKADAGVDPKVIEAKYGLSGGFIEPIPTEQGNVMATVIPTTMNGKRVELVVPHQQVGDQQVYIRDGIVMTPLELSDPNMSRDQFVQSPLIVGGAAGAGAGIGAIAGGGKGAGIFAVSGGAAGLVYDLLTKYKTQNTETVHFDVNPDTPNPSSLDKSPVR